MKGAHLGNELVSAVVAAVGHAAAVGVGERDRRRRRCSDVSNIVAVASVSASQDLSGGWPAVGVPVQVDSS